jgi:hypothetical protein
MKPARVTIQNLALLASTVAAFLLLVELALRLDPSLIGVAVLDRFSPALRQEVGARLGLPTALTRPRIATAERADGGPDIFVFQPSHPFLTRADKVDLDLGAVETIAIDAKGFCNPPGKAARDAADVVMLGDSFMFCSGVKPENTAAAAIEVRSGLRTYNLGISGVGPWEYLELLRRFGLELRPRAVVMNIYEGNDLRDIMRFDTFRLTGNQRERAEAIGGPFAWSYAMAFLKASLEEIASTLAGSAGISFRYRISLLGRDIAMNVTNRDRDEAHNAARLVNGEISPSLYEAPLAAFAGMAKEAGFIPVVAYVPSAYTAYADSVVFDDPTAGGNARRWSDAQRQWLQDNAPKLGMTFIDLVPAFQKAALAGELTHFPANVHLTPAGHRVVADRIAETLRGLGLMPTP